MGIQLDDLLRPRLQAAFRSQPVAAKICTQTGQVLAVAFRLSSTIQQPNDSQEVRYYSLDTEVVVVGVRDAEPLKSRSRA